MSCIPVLMYHHVSPVKGDMVTVAPDVFEAQLRHITEAGYSALSLDEVLGFIEGRLEVSRPSVAITFDDGYLDNYIWAYPALKRFGIKAAVFTVTGWAEKASGAVSPGAKEAVEALVKRPLTHSETKALIDRGECRMAVMDWDMLREMQESGLVSLHSHTVTHRSCDALSGEDLGRELEGSKAEMELRLGRPCHCLCWPRGRFTDSSVEAAKKAGYRAIFTTRPGVVKKGDDPTAIKRIVVKDSVDWFKRRLKIYTSPVLSEIYLAIKD